jgi:hypothetical protein
MDEQENSLRTSVGKANTTPLFSLRSIWPEVLANLEGLLVAEGEVKLAASLDTLMVVDRCRCGSDYCSIVHTQHWTNAGWNVPTTSLSWPGQTRRTMSFFRSHHSRKASKTSKPLRTAFLTILEIVDERIASIELLSDDESRRRLLEALPDAEAPATKAADRT